MSDALDEIIDLFDRRSSARTTRQRANGQRYAKQIIVGGRSSAQERATRKAWLDESKRPPPTLPRVRWLERPDP